MESRRPLDASVWIIAVCGAALLLLLAARYGYHRDELYFLRAGRDLAWGYVDQPPFTPLVARVVSELFGGSLVALRSLPALAFGGLILCAGILAREFGGGRVAQSLAAVCTAAAGQFLGGHHLLSTTPFDWLAWAIVLVLLVRMVRTGATKTWIWIGLLIGVALLNKWMIGFLAVALVVSLLVAGPRRLLFTPWILVGGTIAFALWLPNLLWQAERAWPAVEMAAVIADRFRTEDGPLVYLLSQILYPGPLSAPVWIAGVIHLLGDARWRRFRFIGFAYAFLLFLFLFLGGKPYYLGAMYVALFAAGGVVIENWLSQRRRSASPVFALVIVGALGSMVISLPILPERALATIPLQEINYDLAEQIGWPEFVDQVTTQPDANTVILTANYGEAGAIEHFADLDAYSGHANYWLWGPPLDDDAAVVAVGFRDPSYLHRFFEGCSRVDEIQMPHGIENDEQGAPIVHCEQLRAPWSQLWPDLQHFGRVTSP